MDQRLVWKAVTLTVFVVGVIVAIWYFSHQLQSAFYG